MVTNDPFNRPIHHSSVPGGLQFVQCVSTTYRPSLPILLLPYNVIAMCTAVGQVPTLVPLTIEIMKISRPSAHNVTISHKWRPDEC